jgi:DNA-directed RNA polymerase subunit RPC12/RpoP
MTRPAIYFDFCTYYFLFYLRSLIIAAFVNVSNVICDVGDNENDQTEQAAIAKATKNFRSQCWKEFEPILEDGVVHARCKHCDELMGVRRGQGTSALLTHLKRCKKCSKALKIVQDLSSTLRSPCGSRLKDWSYDPDVS